MSHFIVHQHPGRTQLRRPAEPIEIGTATLAEPRTFHNASYETASWYTECACEPQTVPLIMGTDGMVRARFDGTRTAAYFPSSFAGANLTGGDRPEQIGQPDSHRIDLYSHSLAQTLAQGEQGHSVTFKLHEGYEALPSSTHPSSGGRDPMRLYGIFTRV